MALGVALRLRLSRPRRSSNKAKPARGNELSEVERGGVVRLCYQITKAAFGESYRHVYARESSHVASPVTQAASDSV